MRTRYSTSSWAPIVFPIAALFAVACGGGEALTAAEGNGADAAGAPATPASSQVRSNPSATDPATAYRGPSVGAAKGFAALAYSAITALAPSHATGNLGVSGATMSTITGFEAPVMAYGTDSGSPNSLRTTLSQREVDALVDDIDVRACDADGTSLVSDVTGGITLHPGVTCMTGSEAALALSGRVTLDAGGDPNAFFIIRSDSTLTVADETALVLANGAQACGVFWRVNQQVTIGKRVAFLGTVISDTGIEMHSDSTLVGRALARTAAVVLDRNTITLPVYDPIGSARTCSHLQ